MAATYTALINAPHLPNTVRYAHIFPQIHNKALLSLRNFFDNDYNVKLTQTIISIDNLHDPSMFLHGYRDRTTVMWTIDLFYQELLPEGNSHLLQANIIYELNKNRDIIPYLRKVAFSPVAETWINEINSILSPLVQASQQT